MTQPDAYLFFQHRTIVLGVTSPAMNEQHTSLPSHIGRGEKTVHDDFGLFHRMAMQIDMRLDRIITTVQALRQMPINPWRNAFHVLICVLNCKRPTPFHKVLQISQGFALIGRIERLWRWLWQLLHPTPWVFG